MKTFRKAPWVISVASLGMLIGAVIVESVGPASAAPPPLSLPVSGTVTANQGAAGSSAWPISGIVGVSSLPSLPAGSNNIGEVSVSNLPTTQNVSGNVGITGSLPAGSNDIGTVNVAAPSLIIGNATCQVPNSLLSTLCASISALAEGDVINTLDASCELPTGHKPVISFWAQGSYFEIPIIFQLSGTGIDIYNGALTNLDIPVGAPGTSYLGMSEDYIASGGNGAVCTVSYTGTAG